MRDNYRQLSAYITDANVIKSYTKRDAIAFKLIQNKIIYSYTYRIFKKDNICERACIIYDYIKKIRNVVDLMIRDTIIKKRYTELISAEHVGGGILLN